jgi:putative DNA primase/helicase
MSATTQAGAAASSLPPRTFQRGDEVELATAAYAVLATSELMYDENKLWRYDTVGGVWREITEEVISATLAGFAGAPLLTAAGAKALCISNRQINGARDILRDNLLAHPGRRQFKNAVGGLVAFKNGLVQVKNGQISFYHHSPDALVRYVHPFDYVDYEFLQQTVSLPVPRLGSFLHNLFSDVAQAEKDERVALFQEFVGTSLIGEATKYQVALVLSGGGGNGKSEFLKLAQAAFPPGSVASLPPQMWSRTFHLAALAGALGNFVNEIPERDISDGEVFKAVITGDSVRAEHKHKAPFDLKPVAGHIFSANTLPGTVDQSDAYWRRFVVLPFTRNMSLAPEHQFNAAQAVIDMELPAFVAWLLAGAARVQRQKGYAIPKSSIAMLNEWRRDADSVLKFATEECISSQKQKSATELFHDYSRWALLNNFASMSSTKFYRRFAKTGILKQHTSTGNVYRCEVPRRHQFVGRPA